MLIQNVIENTTPIKDLDGNIIKVQGQPDKNFTVGQALSNILLNDKTKRFDVMKLYILGKKFYSEGKTTLDDADYKSIKEVVEKSESYGPIVLGQILEILK